MPEYSAQTIGDFLGFSRSAVLGMARRSELGPKPEKPEKVLTAEQHAERETRLKQQRAEYNERRKVRLASLPPEERPKKKTYARRAPAEFYGPFLHNPKLGDFQPRPELMSGTKRFLDVAAGECKWPVGDPALPDFRCCGREKVNAANIPYCEAHAGVAFGYSPAAPSGKGFVLPTTRRSGQW